MLLNGAKAMRVALLIALLAFCWIAVYIVFSEELRRSIGDAAHASAFLSLFAGLSALISAFYFRRFAKIRADLEQGIAIGRWRVSRADWAAFARIEEPEGEAGHRATLLTIIFFAIVIPGAMALMKGDAEIFAFISLGIMAIGGLGYLLGRNAAKAHLRYRDGVVAVSEQGVIVNGVAHGWAVPGSALASVEFDEGATPAILSIVYRYWTRSGPQYVTVRAPVPPEAMAEANKTATHLKALASGRTPVQSVTAALLAVLIASTCFALPCDAIAQTGDWRRFKLGEATVATPPGWRAELTEEGQTVEAMEPRSGRAVRVWWWFPDEPLLGYPDEVARDKVSVAGQPALRVLHRFKGRDTISVTLDKPRKDGKRLHILFEAPHLDLSDPVLFGMMFRLSLPSVVETPAASEAVNTDGADVEDAEAFPDGPVERLELGNIAAVLSGPRKKTVTTIHQPIFVRKLTTYHWNDARGRRPGTIALLDSNGNEIGRWAARGKPGQGGVPNAYWEAEVNQRLDQGKYVLTTSSNETWATNAGVGWRGFYTMEYQLLKRPPIIASPEPDGVPKEDAASDVTSIQPEPVKSSSAPLQPAAEDDPARPLKPGETQDLVLYDGGEVRAPWSAFQGQGGNFKEHARTEAGALRVRVPEGSGNGLVGLYSEAALLWLDALRNGGEAVVTFDFDPAETTGFVIGLSTHYNLAGNEPNNPRFVLHWRKAADGAGKAALVRDYNATLQAAAPATAPQTVRLVISEKGVRVEGDGLPRDLTPWSDISEAQGFRIYALTRPDKTGEAVSMALKRITLSRKGGQPLQAGELPASGVQPLAAEVLFDGKPSEHWEITGLHNGQEAKFASFRNGTMIADVPEKQNDRAMAGLLSTKPILRFNERIEKTPYRMTVTVDPRATTGMRIAFGGNKAADMWGGIALRLIRRTEGEMAGKTQIQITPNGGPYAVWDRALSSAFLDKNWDGRIVLTFGADWATAELPGIVKLRGTTFILGPGASKYMTIYSEPEKDYGPSRLVLKKVEGGWITPDGMTAAERWTLVDDAAFDKGRFLDDLAADLDASPAKPN